MAASFVEFSASLSYIVKIRNNKCYIVLVINGTGSGSTNWQGETTGVTITAGQDTSVGSITMISDSVVTAVVPVPDTGQMTSYTTTFGEDNDYFYNPPSYTDNGNGTVTDNVTGLLWQKVNDGISRTWANADTYCSSLSLSGTGWRLPTDFELMTIVDYGTTSPAINITYFPITWYVLFNYWSSTTDASDGTKAWEVSFNDGSISTDLQSSNNYVRCVR